MKVDFNASIKDLDGDDCMANDGMLGGEPVNERVLRLNEVCIQALFVQRQGDNVDGKEKLARFRLADQINKTGIGTLDLPSEDITRLKNLIATCYGPLAYGRSVELLEGIKESKSADEPTG